MVLDFFYTRSPNSPFDYGSCTTMENSIGSMVNGMLKNNLQNILENICAYYNHVNVALLMKLIVLVKFCVTPKVR